MISCNSGSSEVISQKKMQDVLWDMARADALAREITQKDSTKKFPAEVMRLTKEVFLIYHISDSEFQYSYSWYTHHPDIMEKILDSITAKQTRLHSMEIEHQKNFPSSEK